MKLLIIASLILLMAFVLGGCTKNDVQSGDEAPSFALQSASHGQLSLDNLLQDKQSVVIVFYRGFF